MKRYKGLGRVFSFTLTQQLRQRGWRTATIAVALACLLIPILSLTVAAQHQKNAAPEQNPVMEEGYTQEALDRADRGGALNTRELLTIADLLTAARRAKEYFNDEAAEKTAIDHLFLSLHGNRFLEEKIFTSITGEDEIADSASSELASIRRLIRAASARVHDALQKIISSPSYAKALQEPIITMRSERYVVPVKAECRGEVPGLVRELLEAVHKYDYDLRRAAEPQLLAQMKANRLADMKAVRGKHFDPNDPDGEEQEILGILPTHPMVTAVSGATDSAKLLRHLEKAEAKGRLDTLYERRLLDYMRRGNTVVDQTEQAKQDFERQYKRCARKVNGIIAVVGLIVAMVLVFGLRALLFRGTRLVEYTLPIGGLEISVGTAKCVLFGLISALGVYSAGKVLLGTPLMKRFYPKDEKSRAYYARENESARTGKQVAEAGVGMVLMGLLSVYAATNHFGIGGEYVRYSPDGSLFQVVQVENRNLQVYRVEGETDEDGTFAPVENGYAISDGKDHSYYVGELVPGGPTEKKLLAIAEKNGQTIPTVKTQEDIKK